MTAGNAKADAGGTPEVCAETWYIIVAGDGNSHNVSIPNAGGLNLAIVIANALTSSAATTFAPDNSVSTAGDSTNPSTSFTVQDAALWYGGIGNGAQTWSPSGYSGSSLLSWDAGNWGIAAQYGAKSGTGSQSVSWTFGTSEDWVIQADSFKEVGSAQTLTPGLFTNSQSFYAPSITITPVLLPALLTNTQTFYGSEVLLGTYLLPTFFTNTGVFYVPVVSPGAVTLTLALLTNTQTHYAVTVTPGAVSIAPPVLVNVQSYLSALLTIPLIAETPDSRYFSIARGNLETRTFNLPAGALNERTFS